jgi:ABC-type phosphate transport system substrate-binding protein
MRLSIIGVLGLLVMVGCQSLQQNFSVRQSLVIAADEASYPTVEALLSEYERDTAVRPTLQGINPAISSDFLANPAIDALLVSHLTSTERELFQVRVSQDVLIAIAHPERDSIDLSMADIRGLMTGVIINWEQLDSSPDPVIVVTTPEESSLRLLLDHSILQSGSVTSSARLASDPADLIAQVSQTPGAFGLVPLGWLHLAQNDVTMMSIEGISPGTSAFLESQYPLVFGIFLVTENEPIGATRTFLEWIRKQE